VDSGQWGYRGMLSSRDKYERGNDGLCTQAIDEPWVNRNMGEKRTKQHHATAFCNETMGQVGQGNAWSRYAMDEQNPVTVLRAPFIDTQ
jgi:hypothetical protein